MHILLWQIVNGGIACAGRANLSPRKLALFAEFTSTKAEALCTTIGIFFGQTERRGYALVAFQAGHQWLARALTVLITNCGGIAGCEHGTRSIATTPLTAGVTKVAGSAGVTVEAGESFTAHTLTRVQVT